MKKILSFNHLSVFEKRMLFIAFVAHLICVWFSVGFHHPDEHFQLIEFANFKLGKTPLNRLPWEYPAEMRPGLQPFMVYILLKPYYALGFDNPFHFTMILRFISGMTALFTAWQFHKIIAPQIKTESLRKAHLVLSILGWGLVYLHVRFSSENWSAIAFTWAIIALWRGNKNAYWLFGILSGFSFVFRFQALFMIGGAGLWMLFVGKAKVQDILKVVAGFIIVFVFGLLFEYWLYGHFTISTWNYFYQNIVENKAAYFGVEPWYWYFIKIIDEGIVPFSFILLLSIPVMSVYKPKHILTWAIMFFLAGHMFVGHKEFRFLYPLAFFYPFLAVCTIEFLLQKTEHFAQKRWFIGTQKFLWVSFWIVNGVALFGRITKPANDIVALNETLRKMVKKKTVILYSHNFNPYANSDTQGADFYINPLIVKSVCIDKYLNDTASLKGKNVWLFSERAHARDEFMFQYAGSFFDSSRTEVLWTRLPIWTYKYDFNEWLQRSNPYTIYQLHDQPIR